jgi:hypothetical protein
MRNLKKEEQSLIEFMLKDIPTYKNIIYKLPTSVVQEMDDGGMGSLKFLYSDGRIRKFHKEVTSISILDVDEVPINFAINVDEYGDIFELDAFKGDFSPLQQFPVPPYHTMASSTEE